MKQLKHGSNSQVCHTAEDAETNSACFCRWCWSPSSWLRRLCSPGTQAAFCFLLETPDNTKQFFSSSLYDVDEPVPTVLSAELPWLPKETRWARTLSAEIQFLFVGLNPTGEKVSSPASCSSYVTCEIGPCYSGSGWVSKTSEVDKVEIEWRNLKILLDWYWNIL